MSLTPKPEPLRPGQASLLRIGESVSVQSGKADTSGRTIEIDPFDLEVSYQELTGVATRHLREEIARHGVQVVPQAERHIELVVMYVDMLKSAGSFACIIDYRVTTSHGSVRGLQARGWSWNYETACDTAVANVTVETLHDPWIRAYLNGSAPPNAATQVRERSAEQRLRELQRLRDESLITPDEYEAKRIEILREF